MIKRSIFGVLVVVLCSACAAKKSEKADVQETESHPYHTMLEKAKASDPAMDFAALRFAFAKTDAYQPLHSETGVQRKTMNAAFQQKHYEKALEIAHNLLADNYVDIDAHYVCDQIYRAQGKTAETDHHRYMLRGLSQSVINSGNGKVPQTAYRVISPAEIDFVIRTMKFQKTSQSEKQIGGSSYIVVEIFDVRSNDQVGLYFNVDAFYPNKSELN